MLQYKAPLRDMRFLMNEVLDYPQHYSQLSNGGDATPEMVASWMWALGIGMGLCSLVPSLWSIRRAHTPTAAVEATIARSRARLDGELERLRDEGRVAQTIHFGASELVSARLRPAI